MKRIFKTAFCSLLCIAIIISVLTFSVSAAGTVLAFSKSSLTVGESLTVTVTVNSDFEMYGLGYSINYDSSVLQYDSGNAEGGAGSLKVIESPTGEKRVSYSYKFTALKAGSSAISVIDCRAEKLGANGAEPVVINGASAKVTVKDVALSANANLKSLSVSTGKLSPAFSASRKSYNVTVNNDVTQCKIYATAADKDAKVDVPDNNKVLEIGVNTRTVTVTAPDGTQKVYTIKITRKEKVEENSSENDTSSEENSSEDVTSEDPETSEKDPLATNIDGVDFTVNEDIAEIKLFNGFTAQKIEFNGVEIDVAVDADKNYTIYYLTSAQGGEPAPYTYEKATDTFTKLQYLSQIENTYIFAEIPEDLTVGESYYKTSATINGFSVDCYASNNSSLSDFYYIYCYADGRFGMYRYDNRENVMQRYPEFNLVQISDTPVKDTADKDTFLSRFASLSTNARAVVICLALIAAGAIALIVLLILKFARSKADIDGDYDDDDFDSFSLIVNSSSNTDEEAETEETDE